MPIQQRSLHGKVDYQVELTLKDLVEGVNRLESDLGSGTRSAANTAEIARLQQQLQAALAQIAILQRTSGGGTVEVDPNGALDENPLAVRVDGVSVIINGSNELEAPGAAGGITQLTGDVTAGPGSGSEPATLSNTGVAGGTYGNGTNVGSFTVDAKGRLTAAANVAISGSGGAPSDATYWVEDANGSLSAEVVVGTTGITTAAYVSRQAAAKAGRLFLPSNGFYIERDTGAAWGPWGPIFPFTPPVDGDFAWVNQGSSTVSTVNGGIHLATPAAAGDNLRLRVKTAPAVPYTATAALLPLLWGFTSLGAAANNAACGLCFREAGTGEIHTFGVQISSTGCQFVNQKWTNATTVSAGYNTGGALLNTRFMYGTLLWLRIADDNTNRILSVSTDGQNFLPIFSVGRTDFLTADQVGFYVQAGNATNPAGVTLLSWLEG